MTINNKILRRLRANDPTLTSLELDGGLIGDDGAMALAEALKTNTVLRSLNLTNLREYLPDGSIPKGIGVAGAVAIANTLKENTALYSLCLEGNAIQTEGVRALAETLKINTTLISLSLKDTKSNHSLIEGTKALAEALKINRTLQSLNLACNREIALSPLADALKENATLQFLDLSDCHIGGGHEHYQDCRIEPLAEMLAVNTSLLSLFLNDNYIDNEGGKALTRALQRNTTLQELSLIGFSSNIDPHDFLDTIEGNYTLTNLHIMMLMSAEPKGWAFLARNSTLSIINSFRESEALDTDAINIALYKIRSFLLCSSLPDDISYFVESHRLLTALSYLSTGSPEQSLTILIQKPFFTHPELQAIADKAISLALFTSSIFEENEPSVKIAQYQLIAYGARKQSDNPNREYQFRTGLIGLQDPTKIVSFGDINDEKKLQEVTGAEQLVNYDEILELAVQATKAIDDPENDEAKLLSQLAIQKTYHPTTIKALWQSPAFLEELSHQYPMKKTFRLLENYLLKPTEAIPDVDVLTLPANPPEPINATHLENYSIERERENSFNFNVELDRIKQTVQTVVRPYLVNTYYPFSQGNRFHLFSAHKDELRSDNAKARILDEFKQRLESCDSVERLEQEIELIKQEPDYENLKKGQGVITRLFNRKTDSIKAFDAMCDDALAVFAKITKPR